VWERELFQRFDAHDPSEKGKILMKEKSKTVKRHIMISWQTMLAIALVLASAFLYYIHYLIFRDFHHIFIYLVGDIAFVPIEVLIVTLILHRLLETREKRNKMKKLNMVIGAFFSEVGNSLIASFSSRDPEAEELRNTLLIGSEEAWQSGSFREIRAFLNSHEYSAELGRKELKELKELLETKRDFLLALLENPNLLEHDAFTDLLWSVFHLAEELSYRKSLTRVSDSDLQHLRGDIVRAYTRLMKEWISYLRHLRQDYPYLFSLAIRTNPLNPEAQAELS
jgi:hypothetical protein